MDDFEYDDSGKVVLDDIYDCSDPIPYFTQLSKLDYCIPQAAKPHFEELIEARREASGQRALKLVDVGCSYGVNAALLKYDLSMDDLIAHYTHCAGMTRETLMARDRALFSDPADPDLEIVGIDAAANAVNYASLAGPLDEGLHANLEERQLLGSDAEMVSGADLIISTGCYGYVTEESLAQLWRLNEDKRPWMAHVVLRMFDFTPAADMLAGEGYVTEKLEQPIPQRRFASREEQAHVLDSLSKADIDPDGYEADGWYFAELYVSRPEDLEMPRSSPVIPSAPKGSPNEPAPA